MIINHILSKKIITTTEVKFIMICMEKMLEKNIYFGKFFENEYDPGSLTFVQTHNKYCNMVVMDELPEISYDKAMIRLLREKEWPILDFDDDKNYLRLFTKGKYSEENKDEKNNLKESQLNFLKFFEDSTLKYGKTHFNQRQVFHFMVDHSSIELDRKR